MTVEPTKLTETQTKKLEKDYQAFIEAAHKQVSEQCEFLRKHIAKDKNLSDTQRAHLDRLLTPNEDNICPGFQLKLTRVTEANAMQAHNTQVTYEFHDDLFDYLRKPESELPRELRGFLAGGSIIDPKTNKPMMEDLAPLTGKTRTGVPKYDAILDSIRAKK